MIHAGRTKTERCLVDDNLARAAFGGFTGGYLMMISGYWLEAVTGTSDVSLAHSELPYATGNRPGGWYVGIIFQFIDSILLGLLYGAVVQPTLRRSTRKLGQPWGGVASGILFAIGVWSTLSMLIAMPLMGAGIFGWRTGSPRPAVASLLLHFVFGFFLGIIYGDPRSR
jgi:hypothetical protein